MFVDILCYGPLALMAARRFKVGGRVQLQGYVTQAKKKLASGAEYPALAVVAQQLWYPDSRYVPAEAEFKDLAEEYVAPSGEKQMSFDGV